MKPNKERRSLLGLVGLFAALGGCLDPGAPGELVPKTVVEDPALPRIEVAGALLHAEAFGDPGAPAVIVLHGGPGSDYRSLLPLAALADDGYRVVFWDQRGAGLSERFDPGAYTYPLYLEDLRLVVEKMTAPDQGFVFIGQSWGAMYATWFINEYGDYGGRLRGAILTEPGGFTSREVDAFMARMQGAVDPLGEQFNDALWSQQFLSAADHARADYLDMMLALRGSPSEHRDPAKPTPRWRQGAVLRAALAKVSRAQPFDWTTHLGAFGHKVLFLRSELNTAATLAHQQALAAYYADAAIVTIPGVGHEMVWERSDEYLAHTRAYFQAIGFAGVGR